MTMFPIFIIGLVVGFVLGYVIGSSRKEVPSDTKFHLLEADMIQLKADNELLLKTNDELREELRIAREFNREFNNKK